MKDMLLIAGKEIQAAVRSARFAIVCIIVLALFIGATVLGDGRFIAAREAYDSTLRQQAESFSAVPDYELMLGIFLSAYRPPNPGAIVAAGVGKALRDTFFIYNINNPPRLQSLMVHNSFSRLHGEWDLLAVVAVVVSFLALLLSYDALAGEKLSGTISLLCSSSVSRVSIALGKALGLTATLAIPLIAAGAVSSIIVNLTIPGESARTLPLIIALVLVSIIYAAVFIVLGIAVSAMTHRPFRALVALIAVWIALIFVLPEFCAAIAAASHPAPSEDENGARYSEITLKYIDGFKAFPQDRLARRAAWFDLTRWYQEQLRLVWRDTGNSILLQERTAWAWSWLSPALALNLTTTTLCGTNPGSEVRSMEDVWDATLLYGDHLKARLLADMDEVLRSGSGLRSYANGIPWDDIPKAGFRGVPLSQRLGALATGSLTLLGWLAALMVVSIILVRRYDPR